MQRREDHVVADQRTVAQRHAPVVLEMAPGIDEDVAADADVPSEIGVKGREEPERRVDRTSEQLSHLFAQLLLRMVCAVHRAGDAARPLAHFTHEGPDLGGVERPACGHVFQKGFEGHGCRRFSRKKDSILS